MLFPSWLTHQVHPSVLRDDSDGSGHTSDCTDGSCAPRISVAFNAGPRSSILGRAYRCDLRGEQAPLQDVGCGSLTM